MMCSKISNITLRIRVISRETVEAFGNTLFNRNTNRDFEPAIQNSPCFAVDFVQPI